MDIINLKLNKRNQTHTKNFFHLHKVQKNDKTFLQGRSQNSGYPWKEGERMGVGREAIWSANDTVSRSRCIQFVKIYRIIYI